MNGVLRSLRRSRHPTIRGYSMRNPFRERSCGGSYGANIAARQRKQQEMYGGAATPDGASVPDPGHEEHVRFCEECERKKNETYDRAEAARQRGDWAENERLCKEAENYDIAASNDLRRRHGLPLRSQN
jgi:hypothetical protein